MKLRLDARTETLQPSSPNMEHNRQHSLEVDEYRRPALSHTRPLEDGLAQGSALSCTLFLIFINDIGNAIRTSTRLSKADGIVLWKKDTDVEKATKAINRDLASLKHFCEPWKTSRTSLEKLDKVQNAALHLVLGALRSTPIAMLELPARYEPLGLRRGEQTVLVQERYLQTGETAPLWSMVEFATQCRRIVKASVLRVVHDLSAKAAQISNDDHLPQFYDTYKAGDYLQGLHWKDVVQNLSRKSEAHAPSACRLCGEREETVLHVLSECRERPMTALKEHLKRRPERTCFSASGSSYGNTSGRSTNQERAAPEQQLLAGKDTNIIKRVLKLREVTSTSKKTSLHTHSTMKPHLKTFVRPKHLSAIIKPVS
ncbi:hypothetical protein PoB_003963600 [Plakobranchus ocellatus]|uniref:Reverse transcriptase domain-containing protein n=1 Tax=Plakobranchus ocellatus TaxID=259542 RepID=A0AAV4AY08_9GAST|nr:hypothetical protein PoB_003963600 [Plakobranchus ocellatus]